MADQLRGSRLACPSARVINLGCDAHDLALLWHRDRDVLRRPPTAHFHAWYAGHKGRVAIATGDVIDGDLPPRARRLVREWCELRRDALEDNWARVEAELPLLPVEPLP